MGRAVLALALLVAGASSAAARTWEVPAETTLTEALARARDGDTVAVGPGVYEGPFVVSRSLRLLGRGDPVLDGGGRGTVVALRAPGARLEGFVVRRSGASLDEENSGVAVEAPGAVVRGNRLEDVLFGIYLRRAPRSVVERNEIVGLDLPLPRRGDAIRVWYSDGVRLEDNRVAGSRDVVLWYSADLTVRGNRVRDGRYGLHFMYCDDARIEGNLLESNSVGAFLMYSRRLRLVRNTLARNHGPSGYGVGLKDMDDAVLRDNLFVANRVGVFLDNTPREATSQSLVEGNLFVANDRGAVLLPNVERGRFLANSFVRNGEQMALAGGGGDPEANLWRGNHWSDYAGYDADRDGTGDVPYRLDRLFEILSDRHPELRLFLASPAAEALDFAARAFPVVRPQPKLVDPEPRVRMAVPAGAPALTAVGGAGLAPLGGGLLVGALALLVAPALARRRGERQGSAADAATPESEAGEATPLVAVRDLSKRFGSNLALDRLSFTLAAGESVALWGANGAGKTTALRALLGLIPYDGEIRLGGADPWRRGKAARRLVGFVPQEIGFDPALGVAETLDLYARLRAASPERGVARVVALLHLEDELEKRVGELSGGLRQRLALAVALLGDPPLLVLDEPTANLDARSRAALIELLQGLRAAGKTLVFSSHRPDEVAALADRVLCLEDGRLAAELEPEELAARCGLAAVTRPRLRPRVSGVRPAADRGRFSAATVGLLLSRELRDAWRNRWFLLYSVAFAGLALGMSWLGLAGAAGSGFAGLGRTAGSLVQLTALVVPLMGLTLGAAAIAGERERGTLLLLLAQPVTRLELVTAKLLGLGAAVAASLALGFGAAALVIARRGGGEPGAFLAFLGLSLLLALGMVSLGLLISALASRASVASGMSLFAWLTLVLLGDLGLLGTSLAVRLGPRELLLGALVNPLQQYKLAALAVLRGGLEVLGPAGLYAMRTYGEALLPVLALGLLLWVLVPAVATAAVFERRGAL